MYLFFCFYLHCAQPPAFLSNYVENELIVKYHRYLNRTITKKFRQFSNGFLSESSDDNESTVKEWLNYNSVKLYEKFNVITAENAVSGTFCSGSATLVHFLSWFIPEFRILPKFPIKRSYKSRHIFKAWWIISFVFPIVRWLQWQITFPLLRYKLCAYFSCRPMAYFRIILVGNFRFRININMRFVFVKQNRSIIVC